MVSVHVRVSVRLRVTCKVYRCHVAPFFADIFHVGEIIISLFDNNRLMTLEAQ
jgi:hypothetical protein